MSTIKMAFYYEDPSRINRNDGAPLFYWAAGQRLFGKDNCRHRLPTGEWDGLPGGHMDWNFWVDWGEDALMPHLTYKPVMCPKPNIYVTSDTHMGYDYRLSQARKADWVFCNQLRAVEEFVRDGISQDRCIWLPHSFEPLAYPAKAMVKKYDVCFIGNMGAWNRVEFLDRMFKEFPNFYFGKKFFEEAAEKFCSSRVVLNLSIKDDINMRVFEVMGTKSFLLTNDLPTMHHLFKDGYHYVSFKDNDDALDKAKYFIRHDKEREEIAENGYKEVMKKHTYESKLKKMLSIVGAEIKEENLAHANV